MNLRLDHTGALRNIAAREGLRLRITGRCMEPTLRDGEVVEIARDRPFLPGDVVAFVDARGRWLAHRLVGYRLRGRKIWLQTRADAGRRLDPPIAAKDALGRVILPRSGDRISLRRRALWWLGFLQLAARWLFGREPAGAKDSQ